MSPLFALTHPTPLIVAPPSPRYHVLGTDRSNSGMFDAFCPQNARTAWSRVDRDDDAAERGERDRDQLEVGQGERDADDRQG
jgi:hypothetical protein